MKKGIILLCFGLFVFSFPWTLRAHFDQERQGADQGIAIDRNERTISYPGVVRQDEGHVQFLLYAQGYSWLEEESAVTSEISLKSLQHALARIDWVLFDQIWFGETEGENIQIFLEWNDTRISADRLTALDKQLGARHLIFWGSPYFDHLALQESTAAECAACPLFPLEQQAVKEQFVRSSGESGYGLAENTMPPKGTEVNIIMEIKE